MIARLLRVCLWLLCLVALMGAVAAEADYRLAPQDRITITVLKHTELSGLYTVPPDGVIDVPRAGRVVVLGKTTVQLATELRAQFATFLNDPEVTVAVTEARTRSAYALGAVAKPGQYPILNSTRVTELLAAAGDLVGDRTELTAKLVRGQTVIPINLPAALGGKQAEANLLIQEGDLLWVEAPERITVVVNGQVKTPGAVKLRLGSTLVDALAAAGDVLDRPEKMRITLLRRGTQASLNWGDTKREMLDGDVLLVEREPVARIYVNGQVKNPGMYDLPEGGGVLEAITLAGGSLENAALDRVALKHPDGSAVSVNLVPSMTEGQVENNPKLAAGDTVLVPMVTARFAVLGMVRQPGTFNLMPGKPVTVVDAIGMAGGQDKKAKLSEVSIVRLVEGKPQTTIVDVNSVLKKGRYEKNVNLQAGDIVFVPGSKSFNVGEIIQNIYYLGVLAL